MTTHCNPILSGGNANKQCLKCDFIVIPTFFKGKEYEEENWEA